MTKPDAIFGKQNPCPECMAGGFLIQLALMTGTFAVLAEDLNAHCIGNILCTARMKRHIS